jgi:hypothetical protein
LKYTQINQEAERAEKEIFLHIHYPATQDLCASVLEHHEHAFGKKKQVEDGIYWPAMVTSTSTPGSMLMEVICCYHYC